ETGGFLYHLAHFTSYLAAAHAIAGDLEQADTLAGKAITAGESIGFLAATGRARRIRGLVAAMRTMPVDAERWLRDAIVDFRAGEQWFQLARTELDLADVVRCAGRRTEAYELATSARRRFETQRNVYWMDRADIALAVIGADAAT